MEAETHFVHDDGVEQVYRFQHLGPGPASGGDTYNAVDYVDDEIFFGGWVHNPAVYKGKSGFAGEIDFRNKYSHVHSYDINEHSIRLLWSESIHDEYKWAGEISQIIYDPVNDRLLLGRADGHVNLGIYTLPRRGGRTERISDIPALKGSLFLDYACFDMQPNWKRGVDGVQCVDLVTNKLVKYSVESWSKISVDGGDVGPGGSENITSASRYSGYAISAYTRYFHFFRGGLLVGNPVEPWLEEPRFVRLFDFGKNSYGPMRSNALPVAGGILAPFNAYTHGFLHEDKSLSYTSPLLKYFNTVVGPSILVYITPPQARIVAALGARITSMAKKGGNIILGYSTTPNLGGQDAGPIDAGFRGLTVLSEDKLLNTPPPPIVFRVYGWMVEDNYFGGIPLTGYKEPQLEIQACKPNKIVINHYDIGLPPELIENTTITIEEGRNIIDLAGYWGIVSFKLENSDPNAKIHIVLK